LIFSLSPKCRLRERLTFLKKAPLAFGQLAQANFSDAHAFETQHAQTHGFTHAADLTFLALGQNETKLVFVDPLDLRGFEFHAVELKSVT